VRLLAATVVALALAGCGTGKDRSSKNDAAPATAPQLTLDVDRPVAPADGGTQAGHGGGATVETTTDTATITGSVVPPTAKIDVTAEGARADHASDGGKLRITVSDLPAGDTEVRVRATAGGEGPTEVVTIRRR
jgi:hypothetical protein